MRYYYRKMASDDDEDLVALREAALATMKKKPAAVEDAQPIPQLTSSGHSINNAPPQWPEEIFTYNDHMPFPNRQLTVPFPPHNVNVPPPQPQFCLPPSAQFPPNWRGQRPIRGTRGQRNSNHFGRGRGGGFQPNRGGRPPFGRGNNHPSFGQRMPFMRNQRSPFPPRQRMMFDPTKPPPRFGQTPEQLANTPPQGGGGGNLIVINTVPEGGEQVPAGPPFPQGPPVSGGVRGRGGGPGFAGRGGNSGRGGTNQPPVEAKPMLLRPQDKYCPSADPVAATQEEVKEPVHRKKKDKFSRYNSSDDDSDDESEDESDNEVPTRRHSIGGRETEERETMGSENAKDEEPAAGQSQLDRDVPEAEISLVAVNSSQLDSDHDDQAELDDPVIDNLGEPTVESQPMTDGVGDSGKVSEPELNEEDEDRLLASPSKDSDSGSANADRFNRRRRSSSENEADATPVRDESPVKDTLPVMEASPVGSETPVRDEFVDKDRDDTPVRDESPVRELSPVWADSPPGKDNSDQDKSPSSGGAERGEDQSDSDEGSESGDDSDSDSGSSSSDSSSGQEEGSQSSSSSASEETEPKKPAKKASNPPSHKNHDSEVEIADSDSESNEDRPEQRLPSKPKPSANSRTKRSPSPAKPKVTLRPEDQAKLEARRRKFEGRQEVKVTDNKRTISLRGISSSSKKSEDKKQNDKTTKNSHSVKSSARTVQTKVSTSMSEKAEFHHKHSKRKVSIPKPVEEKLDSNSEAENRSESMDDDEDDDDDGGSRSWRREANTTAVRRKTVLRKPLPDSDNYRDHSYRGSNRNRGRGSNRNGGYYRHDRESLRDNRPEVHYSSSDDDNQESDRKLISIVVPRAAAGTHSESGRPRPELNASARSVDARQPDARSVVSGRKRTSDTSRLDRDGDYRHSRSKSKRVQEFSPHNDRSGSINVVISSDRSSSKVSQSSDGRVSVHQRLGKGQKKQHAESSSSGSRSRGRHRNKSGSASGDEGGGGELDQRIRLIQRKNKAIMQRRKEVLKDRELYG